MWTSAETDIINKDRTLKHSLLYTHVYIEILLPYIQLTPVWAKGDETSTYY